jgi:tetratricopeptide (TPR) repeat protein
MLLACGHNADKAKRVDLQSGERFYQKGKYADAEIQFRKAIQEDPRFGEAYLWLGRTARERGNYGVARDGFQQAAALMTGQDAPTIELMNLLLMAYVGDPARPRELYRQIVPLSEVLLSENADSFDGIRVKGYLAMLDGDFAKAADFFQKANGIKPDEADVNTAWVESLLLGGQAGQAEEIGRQFLSRKPACGPVYTVLYQYYMSANRPADGEAVLKSKIAANPKESLYRIELARHYVRTGKPRVAAESLQPLFDNPKDFPGARLEAGDFYMEIRDWAGARQQYEQGIESDPQSKVQYWKRLVRLDLATNNRPAAQRLLEEILKQQPGDREARASRAALRVASNDPQQIKLAGGELKALVDQFPEALDYRIQYAELLRSTGQIADATSQYLLIVQRQPKNAAVLQELADLAIRAQNTDDALKYADRVLALDPHSVRALLVRSAALATKGRFAETRTVLTVLAAEHPGLREAQLQLALLDVEQKRYPEAERRFFKYFQPGRADVRVLEGLVELYRAQNQIGRAIALLQSELEKRPDAIAVRELLANTAARSGQTDIAISEYQRLAKAQPNSPEFALRLGLAYEEKQDLTRAIVEFEEAGKLTPQSPLVHAYLGKALEEAGQKPEAVKAYRQSLSLDSRNPWVMNNLAYLLAEMGGDLNEALKLAQQAGQQDPGNPSFTDTVGWVYLKKRETASAVHVFEAVCAKNPRDATFRIHLATALLESGDANGARAAVETARQLPCTKENEDSIRKILSRLGIG